MNRREFLERVEGISGGVVAGGLSLSLSGCLGFHYVNSSLSGNRLIVRQEDLQGNDFALIQPPGNHLPLYLYRVQPGAFSAVSTRCMHRGCQVEPAADHLVCPCHGSEYTNTGEVLKGPTQRPLRRFPVTVEGDAIYIELPAAGEDW